MSNRSQDDDEEWCSINEAARRLGVTPTAIRNRIKRRTLETRAKGNFGREVRVPRPVPGTVPDPVPDTVLPTVTEPVPDTVTVMLITELRDRIGDLQARLRVADEDRIELQRAIAQERLAASQERAAAYAAALAQVEALKALLEEMRQDRDRPQEQERRGWWRFRRQA